MGFWRDSFQIAFSWFMMSLLPSGLPAETPGPFGISRVLPIAVRKSLFRVLPSALRKRPLLFISVDTHRGCIFPLSSDRKLTEKVRLHCHCSLLVFHIFKNNVVCALAVSDKVTLDRSFTMRAFGSHYRCSHVALLQTSTTMRWKKKKKTPTTNNRSAETAQS